MAFTIFSKVDNDPRDHASHNLGRCRVFPDGVAVDRVFENVFYSELNRTFTTEVLDCTRMHEDYPEAYARVAHRRVTSLVAQKWLFGLGTTAHNLPYNH